MKRLRTRFGELEATVFEPEQGGARAQLVLCHGYGAPGTDLVPVGAELLNEQPSLAERLRLVFFEAPLSLDQLGAYGGRAWWHLDVEALLGQRDWTKWELATPAELPRARRQLLGALEALNRATGATMATTVLGGFSQGAMLTTDVALRAEEAPAALAIFSGTLLSSVEWRERASRRAQLPVLMSHGRQDAILPFSQAERLRAVLTEAGMAVDFVPFEGPHTLWPDALEKLAKQLTLL